MFEGAFAVYLEPWHADVFEFLDLRKNHGKVWLKSSKLFYFHSLVLLHLIAPFVHCTNAPSCLNLSCNFHFYRKNTVLGIYSMLCGFLISLWREFKAMGNGRYFAHVRLRVWQIVGAKNLRNYTPAMKEM